MIETLIPRMVEICGSSGVVSDPLELRTYECDGLTSHRAAPALAVLPETPNRSRPWCRPARRPRSRSWPADPAPAFPAARCRGRRRADRHVEDAPDHRGRPHQPAGHRGTGASPIWP